MVKRKTAIALGIALIIGSQLLRRGPEEEVSRLDGGGSAGIFSFLTGPQGEGKKETTITTTTRAGEQPIIRIPPLPEAPIDFFGETQPTTPQRLFTSGGTTQQLQASLDALRASLGLPPPTQTMPTQTISKKDLSTSTLNGAIPQQTISPFKAPVSSGPSGGIRTTLSRMGVTLSGVTREQADIAIASQTSKKDVSTPQFAPTIAQIQSSPSFGRFES